MKWHLMLHWSLGGAGPYANVVESINLGCHRPDNHICGPRHLYYLVQGECAGVVSLHFFEVIPSDDDRSLE